MIESDDTAAVAVDPEPCDAMVTERILTRYRETFEILATDD